MPQAPGDHLQLAAWSDQGPDLQENLMPDLWQRRTYAELRIALQAINKKHKLMKNLNKTYIKLTKD